MEIEALVPDRASATALRTALHPGGGDGVPTLHFVDAWNTLLERIRDCPTATIVVADPWARGTSPSVAHELSAMTAALGHPGVVLYGSRPLPSATERLLTEEAFSPTLVHGRDRLTRLRSAVAWAASAPVLPCVEKKLATVLDPSMVDVLIRAVATWNQPRNVSELARRFHVSSRHLRRLLGRQGLPAARVLLRWARILTAVGYSRIGVALMADLAYLSGYADHACFYRAVRATTGQPPGTFLTGPAVDDRLAAALADRVGSRRSA